MQKIFKLNDIGKISKEIIKEVNKKKSNRATIVAFSGDLGAGKTTITQSIAKHLGVKDTVISPTFVIMKIYETKDKKFKKFIHIDAYRLNGGDELLHLGFEEISKDKDNLIIIEWPEMVPECLKSDIFRVNLEHKDEETRIIKFCYN